MVTPRNSLERWVVSAGRLWLFLDYDGSLCEFPETPDLVETDPELIELISLLAGNPHLRVAVISGRQLKSIHELLPVPGIILAGVYGVEIQTPEGGVIQRGEYNRVRTTLEQLKPRWQRIILGHPDFFLEDKDWSLALHSKTGEQASVKRIFSLCRQAASEGIPASLFRWFEDNKYLEIVPVQAHKGETVKYLLDNFPFSDSSPVYIGDDGKDQEAFDVIHAFEGMTIQVSNPAHPARMEGADVLLKSPQEVRKRLRRWVQILATD